MQSNSAHLISEQLMWYGNKQYDEYKELQVYCTILYIHYVRKVTVIL